MKKIVHIVHELFVNKTFPKASDCNNLGYKNYAKMCRPTVGIRSICGNKLIIFIPKNELG